MSRGPLTFKQRDLTRAIKAALAAGLTVERAWIDVDGKIMLGFANPDDAVVVIEHDNPWDKALITNQRRAL
ncbi:MAG: hypothetical protein ACREDO_05785 [Methyloceanibacter sp.]